MVVVVVATIVAGRWEMGCATEALDVVVATIDEVVEEDDDLVEAVEVEDSYRKMIT
jgi:hypothetical protein